MIEYAYDGHSCYQWFSEEISEAFGEHCQIIANQSQASKFWFGKSGTAAWGFPRWFWLGE